MGWKKPNKMKTSNYEGKEKKCNSYIILLGLLSRAANLQVTFIEPSLPALTAFIERPLNLRRPENIRRKWGELLNTARTVQPPPGERKGKIKSLPSSSGCR